ncbi:hypothetical protein DQ244_13620 [Blastococcus sp. TBT05-19]|uniref:hypothetical protein n=1 Tax=Blastococcus sp. TBT05-19 TaxID=2250581 RepID=UPI000DE831EA|nr:hypothetical protein [Blastococcus sp. TBT05-19]RBY90469.1 hypothetical protein DQ244_13620 [Blastococcus sp. TBT05-19]
MGVDYVFFRADDDAAAAEALNRPGGPLGWPEVTGHRRTGFFRKEPIVTELGPGYPAFASRVADPVVALGTLTELLTGVDYDTVLEDPRHGADVASTPTGDVMVMTVSDALREAVGSADDARLTGAAQAWSRTEELEHVDPADLLGMLRELRDLSRGDAHARLYVHVSM